MRFTRTAIAIGFALFMTSSWTLAQPTPPAPPPPPAAADTTKSLADSLTGVAKGDYLAGRALFDDGDFASALVKFKSAMEASSDKRLYWNLGACERGLRHYSEAIRDLERYKAEGGALLTDKDRKDADEIITGLRPYVAAVTVHANEANADVAIDEQPVGKTPLEKMLVDLGEHRLVVKKEGFTEYVKPLSITGTSDVVVDARIEAMAHEGRLSIIATAGDLISLDGKNVGVATYEATLPSGVHTVRVTAEGKKAFESRVVIEDGKLRTLDVTLENKPILPLWAWIGIGAAAATGLTIGGYFAFRGDTVQETTVEGTMPPRTVHLPSFGGATFR